MQSLTKLTRIRRRRLRQKQKAKPKTVDELSEMTKARRSLSKRVHELQGCQQVYIPGIADLLDSSQEDERLEDQPEVLKLWLPSQLSDNDRSAWCLPGISHLEFWFRYVQASDALAELRRLRQLFQGTRDQNAKHTKSTSSTTRSQGILDGFHGRTKRVANRYRSARKALLALDPGEKLVAGWKHYFLELKEGDIRGPDRETNEDSEGRFQQSWIWTVSYPQPNPSSLSSSDQRLSVTDSTSHQRPLPSTSTVVSGEGLRGAVVDEKEQYQSHRAHWARAQARAERYEEEVMLTVEEMGRNLKYFEWKKSWWQSISSERAQSNDPPPPIVQDGLHAYARRQADIYDRLVTLFVNHWHGFLSAHSLGSSWLGNYPLSAHPAPHAGPRRGHRQLDVGLSTTTETSRGPRTPLVTTSLIPQESVSQPNPLVSTFDDSTDAPLDGGSSDEDDEDSDHDFTLDDPWGEEDSADED